MTIPPAAGGNSAPSMRVGTNPLQRIEVIMSIGLFVAFFMPWVKIFFFQGSGYDIGAHLDGGARLVWLVPAVAGVIIWAAFTNVDTRKFCVAAGVVTFAALMWGFSQLKGDLFRVLSIGAWLSLLLGGALLLFGIGVIAPMNQTKTGD